MILLKKNQLSCLIWVTFGFVLHRGLISLFLFNELYHVDTVEWFIIRLANDFINQHISLKPQFFFNTLFQYQHFPYSGSSLIDSLVYFPIALIFGIHALSLRMVPLLYSTGAFVLWNIFILRLFSIRTAYLFSFFCIFSSPYFIQLSSISISSYEGAAFFSIAAIVLLSFYLKEKKSSVVLLLLGCVCGIGVYYNYMFLLSLATIGIVGGLHRSLVTITRKDVILFSMSFLVGFLPWLLYNFWYSDLAGLHYRLNLGSGKEVSFVFMFKNLLSLSHFLSRCKEVFLNQPYLSPVWISDNMPVVIRWVCHYLYRIVFFVAFVDLVFFSKNLKNIGRSIIGVYIAVFYLAMLLSSFEADMLIYWIGLYHFIYPTIAVFLAKEHCFQHKRINQLFKAGKLVLLMGLLFMGISDTIHLFQFSNNLKMAYMFKGKDYYFLEVGDVVETNIEDINLFLKVNGYLGVEKPYDVAADLKNKSLLEGFQVILNLHFGVRDSCLDSVYEGMNFKWINHRIAEVKNSNLSNTDWNLFLKGMGWALGIRYGWNEKQVKEILTTKIYLGAKDQEIVMGGYGLGAKLSFGKKL